MLTSVNVQIELGNRDGVEGQGDPKTKKTQFGQFLVG